MALALKEYLNGKLDTINSKFAIIDNKTQEIIPEFVPESLDKFLK